MSFNNLDNSDNLDFSKILSHVEPQILSAAVINLDNVARNYHKIEEEVQHKSEIAAVVKANAYGFGAKQISKKLYGEGCRKFFVATIDESIEVREVVPSDAQIFVLSGIFSGTEEILEKYNLVPVLNCMEQADLWIAHAHKLGKKLDSVIHINTGMSRNGFQDKNTDYDKIFDNLNVLFVMSHLACPDILGHEMNDKQLKRFLEETTNLEKKYGHLKKCLSATNGIFLGQDFQFDIVRPGKALYGFAIREDKIGSMIPVMDLFARIVQINHLYPGDTVGYGSTFTADRPMTTVTIGLGYADGFMRKFGGFGCGFFNGKRMPMVGRISMDYIVLDATGVDENTLKMGEWVALTNSPDDTLEKWALELNTIPHEIACGLGRRIKKVYVGENDA